MQKPTILSLPPYSNEPPIHPDLPSPFSSPVSPISPTTPLLLRTISANKSVLKRSLYAHVPYAVLEHLSSPACISKNISPVREPFMEIYDGVIFFADVSNFTTLVSKLAKHQDLDCGSDR